MNLRSTLTGHQKSIVRLLLLLALIEAALLGCFVWPSLYQTQHVELGMFGGQTIRQNKLTGTHQIFGAGKWQKIEMKEGNMSFPAGTQLVVGGAEPGFAGSVPMAALIIGIGVVELALIVLWSGFTGAAPATAGANAADPPAAPVRSCPQCGLPYRLEDYAPGAEHIYCSRCKHELPQG